MKSGIYKIINLINGKIYIGSAVNLNNRWSSHKYNLNKNQHRNIHLQRAWNKHGKENFKFITIQVIEDKTELIKHEQTYIDWLKPQYNLNQIAGSRLGAKHSEETKKKIGATSKNRKHSKEFKQKMSIFIKNRKHTEETKIKMSNSAKGKKMSEAAKLKMSISAKGRKPNRRINKWPCPDGIKCRCEKCIEKKREQDRNYYHLKRKQYEVVRVEW